MRWGRDKTSAHVEKDKRRGHPQKHGNTSLAVSCRDNRRCVVFAKARCAAGGSVIIGGGIRGIGPRPIASVALRLRQPGHADSSRREDREQTLFGRGMHDPCILGFRLIECFVCSIGKRSGWCRSALEQRKCILLYRTILCVVRKTIPAWLAWYQDVKHHAVRCAL